MKTNFKLTSKIRKNIIKKFENASKLDGRMDGRTAIAK